MTYERQLQADRLLIYGMLDQAEQLYAAVLADEPTNSEAAFGLARVALERGDEELAYERAQHAVRLNPRNDDAQRLEQRLAEIIAARRSAAGNPGGRAPTPPELPPVRPSEQAAFTRNRSMADHRAQEEAKARKKEGE